MNEKKKKKKEKIDTSDYSQQKAWFFLGAYFIFFLAVIISIRSNNSTIAKNEKKKEFDFSFEKIEKKNYRFQYELILDQNQILYEGSKNGTKSLFTKNINGIIENYFESDDLYVKQVQNMWLKDGNPYPIGELIDTSSLKRILQKATYESKTDHSDKSQTYTYQITTTTLQKILKNQEIDIADITNKISITFDNYKDVYKIEYDFTSYAKYNTLATTFYKFTMNFDGFSEVEELKI